MHKNIGDFAESLIASQVKGIEEGKAPVTVDQTWADPNQRDITRIEVPDDFSHQVLQESFDVEVPQKPITPPEPKDVEPLIRKFNSLMEEAQRILEMVTSAGVGTGVGDINVNLGGPGKKARLRAKVRNLRTKRRQ